MTEEAKIIGEAKTAAKTRKPAGKSEAQDVFAMTSFEVPEFFRDATEKSMQQAKETYDKVRTAAEQATDVIEDQLASTRAGVTQFNELVLDSTKANLDATFQFAKDVLAVKTFADVIELNTAFARARFEAVSAQAKDFQELATKVATEAGQPVKDAVEKFMKDLKVA